MGVPARYVEGYILVPGNFAPDETGFSATVYDHQAHAWTEVYVDQVGWVPVEVTPTYYNSQEITGESDESSLPETQNAPQSDEQSQEETMETSLPDETQTTSGETQGFADETQPGGNTDHSGSQSSQGSGSGRGSVGGWLLNIFFVCLGTAIAILGLAFLIWLRAAAVRKQHVRRMRQKNRSQGVLAIYGEIRRLLKVCGLKVHMWDTTEANGDVTACDFIKDSDLKTLTDLANAAAFSRDGVSEEQWRWCWQFYQRLHSRVIGRQKWWKQILIRYIYCC